MIDLKKLENDLNLSEWNRELGYQGRKRTKAGKYYWYIVLLNYHINRLENIDINLPVFAQSYGRIFYRDYELLMALLEELKGVESATISNNKLEESYQNYTTRMEAVWNGLLNSPIGEFYKSKKELIQDGIFEENLVFHSLAFLDKKKGKLPRISRQFRYMLDSFDYIHLQNKIPLNKGAFLKRGAVKTLFKQMDEVYLSNLMRRVAAHLKGFAESGEDKYSPRKKVTTPTEALEFIATMHPDLLKLSNSELKYIININCCQPDGSRLNNTFLESLAKAIRRYHKEQPKWQRLPLFEFKENWRE